MRIMKELNLSLKPLCEQRHCIKFNFSAFFAIYDAARIISFIFQCSIKYDIKKLEREQRRYKEQRSEK
jgi:hypothetical protein